MSPITKAGFVIAGSLVMLAALSPLLASWDTVQRQELTARLEAPDSHHLLGRDQLGRDLAARIIYGARVSMLVGISVVAISSVLGVIIGVFSGYKGGWTDRIFSGFLFNVFMSFPGILLAIAMVAFLGPSIKNLIIALSVIGWVGYARLMRAQALKVREFDFVTAARALGAGDFHIIIKHILPNSIQPLIVQASLGMAGAILAEAGMSFLGLGVPEPTPSWGKMIDDSREFWFTAPHLFIFPGLMIALAVLSFNFIGDGLRERLDPKQDR
ncbi:MAG: peptide ABC transporter permease [Blastocatellia bacterium AA13]|nr:MAG: peptide ABC transporter permease [Blastocatellia bacterium AA13]